VLCAGPRHSCSASFRNHRPLRPGLGLTVRCTTGRRRGVRGDGRAGGSCSTRSGRPAKMQCLRRDPRIALVIGWTDEQTVQTGRHRGRAGRRRAGSDQGGLLRHVAGRREPSGVERHHLRSRQADLGTLQRLSTRRRRSSKWDAAAIRLRPCAPRHDHASQHLSWEFTDGGDDLRRRGQWDAFTTNDGRGRRARCMRRPSASPNVIESSVRDELDGKRLVRCPRTLTCPTFPGYFLYYSSRAHLAPKLRCVESTS